MVGPCVRCGGRDRFSINIQKQVFNCRGCGAAGDGIAMVQHIDGVDFRTAVRTLAGFDVYETTVRNDHGPIALANQGEIDRQNSERALKIWNGAGRIGGTPAERYLHRRSLHDLPDDDVLRFHPACPFGKTRIACLLALYTDIMTNVPKAVGRTAIDAVGNKLGRMSLGPVGGAAIKVDDDADVELGLTVGEGLESVLAARQLGFRPAWALGSAGAIRNFAVLPGITALTIITDNDKPDAHGRQAGQEAALACSARWTAAGIEVRRVVPRTAGADMADIAVQEGAARHG
jgi:Toprim domain/CHC2 zinc finger